MIDSFVLLAPILMLGVIALLGFVGCEFEGVPPPGPILTAIAGDAMVDLSWPADEDADKFHIKRGETSGVHTILAEVSGTHKIDGSVTNGTTYFYVVTAWYGEAETEESNEVMVTPVGPFVTSVMPGTASPAGRAGLYGMAIQVGPIGPSGLTIHTLGRAFALGLTGTHEVKIIDAISKTELGHASVDMTSSTVGDFKYGKLIPADLLAEHVTLAAGGVYYVVSEEFTGGDPFYEQDTNVQTRPEAMVQSGVYSDAPGLYVPVGGPGQTFGPVSFQY